MNEDLTFDEWFDIFVDHAEKTLNYDGPIDKYSFEAEYEDDKSPEAAAESFVKAMKQ